MVKDTLTVIFDNQYDLYFPEQLLTGKVRYTLHSDAVKIEGINCTLRGDGGVRWTEGGGKDYTVYTSRESYLVTQRMRLLAPEPGHNIQLQPGTYEYPFRFQLPKEIPSSFEGEHGSVRYQIEAQVSIPWALDTYTYRIFTIVNPLDLNDRPDVQHSLGNEEMKNLCCWCCKSDPIMATMVVKDKAGFVPGETISFSSEITNNSSRTMKKSVGRLLKHVTYRATTKIRTWTTVLVATEQGPIRPGGSDSWTDGKLPIPTDAPSSYLKHCNIISISYSAEMQVVPTGWALSLKVPVSIVIGNVPLRNVPGQYYSVTPPVAPAPLGASSDLSNDHTVVSSIPQFGFAESDRQPTKDDDGGKNTSGTKTFTPANTYYMWDKQDTNTNFSMK